MNVSATRSFDDLLVGSLQITVLDIVTDRIVEERCLLRHYANGLP